MPKLSKLEGRSIHAKKLAEGLWLVGWLFDSRKTGDDTMSALADLYNAFDEAKDKKPADGQSTGDSK